MSKKLRHALPELTREFTRLLIWAIISATVAVFTISVSVSVETYYALTDSWETVLAISSFLIIMTVMWFAFGWSSDLTLYLLGSPPPHSAIRFTDEEIHYTALGENIATLRWGDLVTVCLVNADSWPIGHLNWMLFSSDGNGAVIPSEAQGMDRLLAAMQKRLPAFDNEAVIRAMVSTEGSFLIWQK